MKTYRIAAIPGDGIGKEVIPAGLAVLSALAIKLDNVMPSPLHNLPSSAAVGLTSSLSIFDTIARLTPERSAKSFAEMPRRSRCLRIPSAMRRSITLCGSSFAAAFAALDFIVAMWLL